MSAVLTEPSQGPRATEDQVRRAPKVLLHDHLDGGLRPATIVELAAEVGHELPADTPEALGDYCSGTNHVLPTNGAAHATSGVSVSSYQNFVSVQSASVAGIAGIGRCAVTLAEAEGLEAHANAVRLRLAAASREAA